MQIHVCMKNSGMYTHVHMYIPVERLIGFNVQFMWYVRSEILS